MSALGWSGMLALLAFAPLNYYCAALLGRSWVLLKQRPVDYYELASRGAPLHRSRSNPSRLT